GERIKRKTIKGNTILETLSPITLFCFNYTSAVFAGNEVPMHSASAYFTDYVAFLPRTTFHLWFLYYLILITAATVVIAFILSRTHKLTHRINTLFGWIIQRTWTRVLFFSGMIYLILSLLDTNMIDGSVSFFPNRATFIYYFFFYLTGWLLYPSKQYLNTFMQYDWACVILAIALTAIQGLVILNYGLDPGGNSRILMLFSSFIISLLVFGITGLFIRYFSKHSARMRYISDSSYWVYLIHLPLTAILPVFVWELPLPAIGKFLLVLTGTTLICFVSYHYLVRNTFIGRFLNGRKYPRRSKVKPVGEQVLKGSRV
ncbi:MAG: acyltransferase family protein, partial [Bacteroidota bacterium]